mmetsp:Transcript_9206/g.24955  ORF Transcript_9206/g.24955 Transcript_9206/m.24955 type:complete len:147 (-) Transcript_9206:1428-1868(-)
MMRVGEGRAFNFTLIFGLISSATVKYGWVWMVRYGGLSSPFCTAQAFGTPVVGQLFFTLADTHTHTHTHTHLCTSMRVRWKEVCNLRGKEGRWLSQSRPAPSYFATHLEWEGGAAGRQSRLSASPHLHQCSAREKKGGGIACRRCT